MQDLVNNTQITSGGQYYLHISTPKVGVRGEGNLLMLGGYNIVCLLTCIQHCQTFPAGCTIILLQTKGLQAFLEVRHAWCQNTSAGQSTISQSEAKGTKMGKYLANYYTTHCAMLWPPVDNRVECKGQLLTHIHVYTHKVYYSSYSCIRAKRTATLRLRDSVRRTNFKWLCSNGIPIRSNVNLLEARTIDHTYTYIPSHSHTQYSHTQSHTRTHSLTCDKEFVKTSCWVGEHWRRAECRVQSTEPGWWHAARTRSSRWDSLATPALGSGAPPPHLHHPVGK